MTELDVRPDLAEGRDPLDRILEEADRTPPGGAFAVVAPFEPVPLLALLERQGFTSSRERLDSGDWRVLFTREA